MKKRTAGVILAAALIFLCSGFFAHAKTANNLVTNGGTLIVEAEDLKFDETVYKLVTGDETFMSGGAAIGMNTATPEDKTNQPIDAPAHIDLSFEADVAGTYTVWVRNTAYQVNSGANSLWISLADGNYNYMSLNGNSDAYAWSRLGSLVVKEGEVGSVRIRRRQRGSPITMDKFVITSNPLYMPQGISGENTKDFTLPADEYEIPKVTPPQERPRLWFRASDIETIRENFTNPKNANAYSHWRYMLKKSHSGRFPTNTGHGNYDTRTMAIAEAKAFDYAINGNEQSGNTALSMAENMLATADFTGYIFEVRAYGHLIASVSKIYDWCYPLIKNDTERKNEIIYKCEVFATKLSIGYPPRKLGTITSHGSESQVLLDLLSLGIAAYNERPDIYNYVAGKLYGEFVKPRQYWNRSHSYHQGSGYVGARFYWDIVSNLIFSRMTGNDRVFITDSTLNPEYGDSYENMRGVFYESLYRLRPDGQFLRLGDDYNEYCTYKGQYWTAYNYMFFYGANYFSDPYLLDRFLTTTKNANADYTDLAFSEGGANQGTYSSVMYLILNNPNLEPADISELGKTMYCPGPNGMMLARTGWDINIDEPSSSNNVVALMKIGERNAANHNHRDSGSFQLYYKGILASESGFYDTYGNDHDSKYHKTSIAHNVITVRTGEIAGGGQRTSMGEPSHFEIWMNDGYKTGEVLAHEYGPDAQNPEYSYIKGDVADAYSSGVEEATRSMLFMPLENSDYPAAMVVFDKVTSSDAAYKKSWLLHMQEEPAVNSNENRISVTRTQDGYGGKMDVQTLLPINAEYTTIGGEGHEFEVNGVNYPIQGTINSRWPTESGWGRVEISPSENNLTDYFLNVLTVSDAGSTAARVESTLFENNTHYGAAFLDRLCLFAKNSRTKTNTMTLAVPSGTAKVFIECMEAGNYVITDTLGESALQRTVSADGGVLYFDAVGGRSYTIAKGNYSVNGLKVYTDNGKLFAEVRVDGAKVSGKVIFAVYDKDGAIAQIESVKYGGTDTYKAELDAEKCQNYSKVKAFLWSDKHMLQPITKGSYTNNK